MEDMQTQDLSSLSNEELAERREAFLNTEEQPLEEPKEPVQEETKPEEENDGFVFDTTKYQDMSFTEEQLKLLEKKDKQIFHEQKMIQKQSQEVAEARRKEIEVQQKEEELQTALRAATEKAEVLKDDFYTDQTSYDEAVLKRSEVERELNTLRMERDKIEKQQIVMQAIPEFNSLQEEIAEVIKNDMSRVGHGHQAEEFVKSFQAGNWTNMDPIMTIAIAERAKLLKVNREYATKLKDIVHTPDDLGKKLAHIAAQRPAVSGGGKGAEEKTSYTPQELSSMTSEQLRDAKQKLLANL